MENNYIFYFDESFHSRVINKSTISALEYFDNYIGVALGFKCGKEYKEIIEEFEDKNKKNLSIGDEGELKSSVISKTQYKYGIKTFKEKSIQLYMDFWKMLEKIDILPYIYISNKLEYILRQLYFGVNVNDYFCSYNAFIYTIVKAINVYRPSKVLNMLLCNDNRIMDEIKNFFIEKIEENKENPIKEVENNAYRQALILIDSIDNRNILFKWEYTSVFVGIDNLLLENSISKDAVKVVIDREGKENNTISACREFGFENAIELDSKECIELRCSDMLCGFIGKMMRAIYDDTKFNGGKYDKRITLSKEWFMLNENQFNLYKQIALTLKSKFSNYYSTFVSTYFDVFFELIAIIYYMDNFENFEEYNKFSAENHRNRADVFILNNLNQKYQELFYNA